MNDLKISVVMPFYDTPIEFFMECISSVKKLNPFEIILVDDCSTDEQVIKIAKNSGCRYIKTAYQSGSDGHPFNVGVKVAKGDYICRVDSDDILLELPTQMLYDIHFGNTDRVAIPKILTVEELILAPRAIFSAMVIKKELLLKYSLAEDSNVFADILLTLRLLHNKYSYDIHKTVNYIYRKRENSIQTSQTYFQHRLRQIQTVSRFCSLENIEPIKSIYYLKLAMLNVKYGSNSRKVYRRKITTIRNSLV
jgi:glycosyltransferase involved in cell wall biosynthesis